MYIECVFYPYLMLINDNIFENGLYNNQFSFLNLF